MKHSRIAMTGTIGLVAVAALLRASDRGAMSAAGLPAASPTVEQAYPGLASGSLTHATLRDLPAGVLLKAQEVTIGQADVADKIAQAPEAVRGQLTKNGFFVLENIATEKLLLLEAGSQGAKAAPGGAGGDIIQQYLEGVVAKVTVSDEEIADFYDKNKDMCGGATLSQVKDQLKQYVLQEKRQDLVEKHIDTLGQRIPIQLSAAWVKDQAVLARDNAVDRARQSGRPSIVDFGASGCRPCDMMTPILSALTKKYQGKANVLFVHVREEQILAARYGIQSIPVQVFFDDKGREVLRHTGFFAQDEIEKKLAELGVK